MSSVSGSTCPGRSTDLGRTSVPRGGPIFDGNLSGLGGLETK